MTTTPSSDPKTTTKESAAGEEDPGAAVDTSATPGGPSRLPEGHPDGEKVPCPGCDGVGRNEVGEPCATCDGKGTITVSAVDQVKPKQ